jgi:tRNA-modifying protein YgfZ
MKPRVFALSDRAALVVSGKDRTSWLNGMVTCDVSKLEPGKAAYGLLVEKKGRIQADFYIVASADALALAVPRELASSVYATLDHHLIMEDAELTMPDLFWFHAAGPGALELAKEANASFAGELDLLATGGGAIVAVENADAFTDLADPALFDALRIERGLPRFGAEFDTAFYPQEASLEKLAVSFDKGCYLGQEVVYMLENRGHVKKKLVPLDLEGTDAATAGAHVTTAEGEAVGEVKSSVIGPTRNQPVAIGLVKWAHTKPGTTLLVDGRKATVRAFP